MTAKLDLLRTLKFGQRIAEEETQELGSYFVETDQWRQIYDGEVDVVYGAKGSGKSALYSLLIAHEDALARSGVILATAENPRGSAVFNGIVADPPLSEQEFVGLWKLYLLGVIAQSLHRRNIKNAESRKLLAQLRSAGIWSEGASLKTMLADALEYAKRLVRPEAIEGGVKLDPVTGMPTGVTGKIVFGEPNAAARSAGFVSVDSMFGLADRALGDLQIWVLIDRLDVAFAESHELEANALRALFRVYLDLTNCTQIYFKVFLRTDIWVRITSQGFREASHITRHTTIGWSSDSLLNLVVRRLLHNKQLLAHFGIDSETVLGSVVEQKALFSRLFPDQIDVGPSKPSTFDWMLSRTRDATKENVPRELIHFLNELRNVQIRKLEIGQVSPEGDQLFARSSFKEALPEVSRARLTQTLYAEYPSMKPLLAALTGGKTQHTADTLAIVWKKSVDEARECAERLAQVGFFEKTVGKDQVRYWVPFLYRDALALVQGSAEPN